MDIHLGSLDLAPALTRPELLAPPVAAGVRALAEAETVLAAAIDPALSDTAAFCERYDVGLERSANCVIVEAKRGERTWLAACVILGSTRADINGLVRRTLDARRVSFAPMERAVAETGMEYGAITPIGLPADWPILVDQAVADCDYVIIGAGKRAAKLAVPGRLCAVLPGVQILAGLGQAKA